MRSRNLFPLFLFSHSPMMEAVNFARGVLHFVPFLLVFLVIDILVSLTIPLSFIYPTAIYNFNSHCAAFLWGYIQAIFNLHKPQITYSGDYLSIPDHENALVISNHVSWSDFWLIQGLAMKKGMLGRCRYFAKSTLKWVPLLGWGFVAIGMPLVSRNWTKDEAEFKALFEKLLRNKWPMWLIAYSEGTRFTPEKLGDMKKFAEAKGKPVFTHCLYPRPKGFVTCVQNLRTSTSHMKHIYDITIAYSHSSSSDSKASRLQNAPTIWQVFCLPNVSPPWRFHVHIERFSVFDLPSDEEGISEWLEERWRVKDEILKGLAMEWVEFGGLGEVGYVL